MATSGSADQEQQPVSNDVALRIGLAARLLPHTSVSELIEALQASVGTTLDEAALSRVTVTHLKQSLRHTYNLDGEEDGSENPDNADIAAFKDAVRVLWGESCDSSPPPVQPYADGDMPRSVRVAVASNEGEKLDGHFGSCLRFLVYQVSPTEIRLVDVRSTLAADMTSDKNGARVTLIGDCRILYTQSIGGPAMAKVFKADIHISQHAAGGPAREVLDPLKGVLSGSPPPWLAKAIEP